MFRLETERLVIRPWADPDRPALKSMMANEEVTRFVHHGVPYSDEDVENLFQRQSKNIAEHDVCMGAVVEKSTGRIVGLAGIQPLGTTGDLEIGWVFAREVWGQGYATEAGAAAMQYVLGTLSRPRVVAIIDPGNEGSIRVATRLGMLYEGRYTGAQLGHRMPEILVDLYYRNAS